MQDEEIAKIARESALSVIGVDLSSPHAVEDSIHAAIDIQVGQETFDLIEKAARLALEAALSAVPATVTHMQHGEHAMTPTANEVISRLREDMRSSPVDDVAVISRQQLDVLEGALSAATASVQPSAAEPVAWWHKIKEPDKDEATMFSSSPNNPWSHWISKHLESCEYSCMPLFATPPVTKKDGLRDIVDRAVNNKATMYTEFGDRPKVIITFDEKDEAWRFVQALADMRKALQSEGGK